MGGLLPDPEESGACSTFKWVRLGNSSSGKKDAGSRRTLRSNADAGIDERRRKNTPLGLFNYARSYWQSGVLLHRAKPKVSHPDAPVTLLLAHAIELYLKAFLRLRGLGVNEVKGNFGHDFRKLVGEASARGLSLMHEDLEIAAILTEQESIRRSRYIETGYFKGPPLATLSGTCRSLDESMSGAFKTAGIAIRSLQLSDIKD
jgi:hypothetical protein